MSRLISKLQQRNFGPGEFADEKPRTLEEVIGLIKNFPDEKVAVEDPDDPAVVIADNNGNYLRLDIRSKDMLDLRYFGAGNKYYIYSSVSFETAVEKVKQFFSGEVDLNDFFKESFDFEVKKHFVTQPDEYRLEFKDVVLGSFGWLVYFLGFAGLTVYLAFMPPSTVVICFIFFSLLLTSLPGWVLLHIYSNYSKKKNQYLKISKSSDVFLFGGGAGQINTYRKSDVAAVNFYVDLNRAHSPNKFALYEVLFKNNTSITFTNALISPIDFEKGIGSPMQTHSRSPLKLTWAAP
jgi:hypothetical protein